MVIIVYSTQSNKSIKDNMGVPDYSYYFVLDSFRAMLSEFGKVVEVARPDAEVDLIYDECRKRNEPCVFLSFTPPFKTLTDLKCPTASVFAWEYSTIPFEVWGGNARNDWRYVFRQHGCAITHSAYCVHAVQQAMGGNFPIWSIPAPIWDTYQRLAESKEPVAQSPRFHLSFNGSSMDFKGFPLEKHRCADHPFFIEERSCNQNNGDISVSIEGVVYTAVFNPGDSRKNWMDMAKGFIWAFRDTASVTLVLKLIHQDFSEAREMIWSEMQKLSPFQCRVIALHGLLNPEQYETLIRGTTYVVNTSHGEGQCLPLMEFMSAGKPAIAPAHTSMREYVTTDNSFVINANVEWTHWPHDPRCSLRALRYRIDWESLFNAFKESHAVAMGNPARYAAMSRNASDALQKYCSTAVVRERLTHFFKHCLQDKRQSQIALNE
jgi:glycosyltransferase involved in cell wall biosynthesis